MSSVDDWVKTSARPGALSSDSESSPSDEDSSAKFLERARRDVLTSRTATRIQFLEQRLVPWAKKEARGSAESLEIVGLLTWTIPRYSDKRSRNAALAVVEALVRAEAQETEKEGRAAFELLVESLAIETQRSSRSISTQWYGSSFSRLTELD
jgi:hypothetical protein